MYLIFNSPKERDLFYEQIVQQPGMRVYTKNAEFVLCIEKKKPNNILLEGCKQFRKIKLTKYFLLCPGSSPQYISHFGVLF